MKKIWLVLIVFTLGCESDNDHFCAKYSYYYTELSAPDLMPKADIRRQLEADLKKKPSDKTRMMLFVLDEMQAHVKPDAEPAQNYCQRRQRWNAFESRR